MIIPAADALETVSVTTSNYDAEFGRSGGAITNVTLKSGTNTLKGSGFFFGNNEKTNAGDYFTHLKAPTKFVNGGFTLGGPIVRNKLFFFGDYQRTVDNLGYVVRTTVPTVAMRNWRLQRGGPAHLRSAHRRHQRQQPRGVRQQPDSGRIASARSRRKLLAFVPLPNLDGAALGQNNFQQAQVREKTTDGFDAKVNYTDQREGPDVLPRQLHAAGGVRPGPVRAVRRPRQRRLRRHRHQHQLQHRGHLDARGQRQTVLDVRGGLNYYHNITTTTGDGLTTSTDVGIPGANLDEFTSGAVADQHRRLRRSAPRVLGQPAVGSLRADLERRRRR